MVKDVVISFNINEIENLMIFYSNLKEYHFNEYIVSAIDKINKSGRKALVQFEAIEFNRAIEIYKNRGKNQE